MEKMIVIGQWIIVGIAAIGFIFNTGVLWGFTRNDIKHLRESVEAIWKEINAIKAFLMEQKKK